LNSGFGDISVPIHLFTTVFPIIEYEVCQYHSKNDQEWSREQFPSVVNYSTSNNISSTQADSLFYIMLIGPRAWRGNEALPCESRRSARPNGDDVLHLAQKDALHALLRRFRALQPGEESGVWQTLKKKKDWSLASSRGKKKELTHVYSHSHRAVHTSRHDGEKAWSLTSSRTRWRIEGRKAQSQIFCQISRWLRGNLGKR